MLTRIDVAASVAPPWPLDWAPTRAGTSGERVSMTLLTFSIRIPDRGVDPAKLSGELTRKVEGVLWISVTFKAVGLDCGRPLVNSGLRSTFP
jgi:hypothetical protein